MTRLKKWLRNHDEASVGNAEEWTDEDLPYLLYLVYEHSGAKELWEAIGRKLKEQQAKVANTVSDIKESLAKFEERFRCDFEKSIDACKTRDSNAIENSPYGKVFKGMGFLVSDVRENVRDTIISPVQEALCGGDIDSQDDSQDTLKARLEKVVQGDTASSISRSIEKLLMEGYKHYALRDKEKMYFRCSIGLPQRGTGVFL